MRALIIGEQEKQKLSFLKEYAENNQFSFDDMLDIKNGAMKIAGDMGHYTTYLPVGFRVVFTVEQNVSKGEFIKTRHISVSVDKKGKLPSVESVQLIMDELGFDGKIMDYNGKQIIKREDIGDNHQAINVIERITT